MLLMLSDIYDKVGLTDIDTKILRSAIYSENTWALDWEMPGIVGSAAEETPPEVTEVVDYLDMWSFLEESHNSFSAEDKMRVANEAAPFGKHIRFPGFDGNNEPKLLGIARLLIADMGRFSRFAGRDLNSHAPLRQSYARMFKVFERMRSELFTPYTLSPDQVITILQARKISE
ncbi:hypothetical protein ATN79_00715 [Paraburkholderia caribensis]|nr:hypothetical protein ATN79_00715 [Paraburkholderia caribensis]